MRLAAHRELILGCCRLGEADENRLRVLVEGEVNWGRLIGEARRLELAPLVGWRLERMGGPGVPAKVLDRLREIYRRNLGRNLHLAEELGEVLDLFAAAEIPAIPLKGPVLAERVFGHPGLRRIYDLDVLVHGHDLERAVALLRHSGYRTASPRLLAGHEGERDLSLVRGAVVELHWALKDRFFHLPVDALWEGSREEHWHGRTIRVLPPELLLLQLIHHLNYHAHPLKILVDVARVLALHGEEIDWMRVGELARSWHLQRNVRLALEAAETVLSQPLPAGARELCRALDGAHWWLRSLILSPRWYFSHRADLLRADGYLRSAFSALSLDGSPARLVQLLAHRRRAGNDNKTRPGAGRLQQAAGLAAGAMRVLLVPPAHRGARAVPETGP